MTLGYYSSLALTAQILLTGAGPGWIRELVMKREGPDSDSIG